MTAYLTINHISKSYSFHHILNDLSFVVNAGERIGLVGANGVGKSTLLKIVTGEIKADSDETLIAPDRKLGYLVQIIEGFDERTLDDLISASTAYLHDLEDLMRELERQMTNASGDELDAVMSEYGETADQFERYGGYEIGYRIDIVLSGLDVASIARDRTFGTLSGGEKARVGLAMLLLQSPDVLLLDEPTNHLDFATMHWLENYLQGYRGAILVVSHDRQFLNRIATAMVEIDEHSRSAKRYSGDYDTYQRAKAQERQQWVRDYAQQQEEIKALRIALKETAHSNANYRAHTDNDKFTVGQKSRIVLVGVNGAGKSTLLRILTGFETHDAGEVYVNPGVKIGYLDQEGNSLDPDLTVFEAYQRGLEGSEQALKSILLQSGLFRYDDLDKRVGVLSAGQERKLQIARLIADQSNLLMLDEPTNYVSFDVLEELEAALKLFPGPVIAASHDRRFIQQFGGEVWALEDGHLLVDGYAKYVEAQVQQA